MSSLLASLTQVTPIRLRFQLMAFSVARTIVNTSHRMVYPFLPAISRGLGVDQQTVSLAITARFGLGLLSPFIGSFADRRGRKTAMLLGLSLFTVGMVLVTIWPTYPALFAALLLTSLCKILFDPATHAYVGDKVDYQRRGLAIAIVEFGWSGAFLLGIPIAGWLIARYQWNTPYLWLAILGFATIAFFWRILPPDSAAHTSRPSFQQGLHIIFSNRAALAVMAMVLLINGSSEAVSIVFGSWMESAFALKVTELGIASAVIGIAELGGEGVVAGIVDRLGKRRSVGFGLGAYAVSCILLPVLGQTAAGALIGLFLFFITFEFTIVSTIPLMTQIVPSARATLLASTVMAVSVGRALGTLVGPALFTGGIHVNATAAAFCNLVALALLILYIREGNEKHESNS